GPVRAAALAWFEGSRITLDWAATVDAPVLDRRGGAKLLLNAVLLAGEALPGQGALSVARDGDAIVVTALGRNPALKGAGEAWLGGATPADTDAHDVNAAYAAALARSYGMLLTVTRAGDTLSLRLAAA
ncbi:MAG: hypothetical protein JWM77_2377, partial [Rhodospirillales bacterium]|nr:hypothetical protein [Rhodospirillales bacterium]